MESDRTLLVVRPDGTTSEVSCNYEGIKRGVDDAIISHVSATEDYSWFIDDEGMLKGLELNIVASMLSGMALYGPCVLIGAEPDDEGDTVPPPEIVRSTAENLAVRWKHVVKDLWRKGQRGFPVADPDTIPPAEIRSFDTQDELFEYLFGGQGDD